MEKKVEEKLQLKYFRNPMIENKLYFENLEQTEWFVEIDQISNTVKIRTQKDCDLSKNEIADFLVLYIDKWSKTGLIKDDVEVIKNYVNGDMEYRFTKKSLT